MCIRDRFDVVGVGLNATDTLILIPHFPPYGGKVPFTSELLSPGGQVASAMVCCAKLGLRTKYIGAIGDDERGRVQWESCLLYTSGPLFAARPLTLEEAQQLAAKNNRNLQLARLKVQEAMHKRAGARADYFPKAAASATDLYFSRKLGTTVTAGELGLGFLPPPFPSIPVPINLVKQDLFLGGITVGQPLTQLFKIQQEVRAATSEQEIAAARSAGSEDEVRYAVEQLYYALLVSQRQRQAAESKLAAAEQLLADAENAVDTGNALKVASIGRRAGLLEARQNLLACLLYTS